MDLPNNTAQVARSVGNESSSGPDMVSEAGEAEDIPSRPSSRLGFNQSTLPSHAASDAPVVLSSYRDSSEQLSSMPRAQLEGMKYLPSAPSLNLPAPTAYNTDEPSSSTCIERKGNNALPAPVNRSAGGTVSAASPTPRKPTTSVSRLCFPFVTTSPRRKKIPIVPPPPRHKYSCFPTKLAPYEAARPAPVHERHKYRHHGHSRQALDHTKWLWSLRQDELKGGTTDTVEKVYPGLLSEPVGGVHPTTHPGVSRPADQKVTHGAPAPMSIHPRRGDISALRDPYCVEADRSLINLPTWSIGKTLWMHDLHLAFENRRPCLKIILDDDVSDAESELEMEMSRSTGYSCFSEDSEATLFDSETEFDSFDSERLSLKMRNLSSTSTSSFVSPALSPVPPTRDFTMKAFWSQPSLIEEALIHHSALTTKPAWTTNWYQRWEVLKVYVYQESNRKDKSAASIIRLGPFDVTHNRLVLADSALIYR